MNTKLDTASVGYPITRFGVSFFPVYLAENETPEISTEGLVIDELDAETVPGLSVRNPTEKPVLLIEGEHLVGGNQNRAVNSTVLVPPLSELEVPVSCIEQGRWGQRREYIRNSSFTPRNVRSRVQETVNASMRREGSRQSDQGAVWREVDRMLDRLEVTSDTGAAADAEEAYRRNGSLFAAVDDLIKLGPLPKQNGIVVTHGTRVKAIELFSSQDILAYYWKMLVRSYMLESPDNPSPHSAERALWAIRRFGSMNQKCCPGIGMGTELRMIDQIMVGQALMLKEAVVHASMFTRN
ncbi:MAG: hypothetical protein OXF23_01855 [Candidatus Dadabacteria bacterium]|nr:hypothetical protein [Candidatus Dadabacteria bacterium]MCY4263067.1 hypothetical protein [Candidatus Dadabacteria bacterium]